MEILCRLLPASNLRASLSSLPPQVLVKRFFFREHGVAAPHEADESAPMVETRRRYRSDDKANVAKYGGDGGYDYGKTVKTRPCRFCNAGVEVPGTSVWWGKGKWKHLLNGNTDDFPSALRAAGYNTNADNAGAD